MKKEPIQFLPVKKFWKPAVTATHLDGILIGFLAGWVAAFAMIEILK